MSTGAWGRSARDASGVSAAAGAITSAGRDDASSAIDWAKPTRGYRLSSPPRAEADRMA